MLKNTSISGSVSFAPKVDYSTGTQPRGCAITDFDGDGKLDISVVNANSNTISFFRNLVSGVIPNVTANSSSTNSICAGSSITLTGGGANTYIWSGGVTDGASFIPPIGTTTYTVTGTINATGCSDTAIISITSGPDININSSVTSLCIGESITLNAVGADSYSWNNGIANGVSFVPPIGTNSYTVIGTNTTTGCLNSDSIQITVNPLPNVLAGIDQTTCQGQAVTLNASGGATYSWNNNVVNNIAFTPSNSNTYIVVGTDANGCQDSDTVSVTVNANSSSQLTHTATGTYTLNGQTYTQSGIYTQIIPNANGCDSTITLNLIINNTNGLKEYTNQIFSIYPNPTTEIITIDFNKEPINTDYILFDISGRSLMSGTLTDSKTEINLSKLSSGTYYIRIFNNNVKLVKQ